MSSPKPALDDLRIERRPEAARSSNGAWLVVLVAILALGAGAGLWWKGRADVVEVQTVAARKSGGSEADRTVLHASGYVTARREATVSAKVTGKVEEVLFEEGLKVKEKQIL